uniref:signal peptidase II n=1 Tax=uncultured Acidovorax sp. TaxID=158751 RepID=UPI00076A7635
MSNIPESQSPRNARHKKWTSFSSAEFGTYGRWGVVVAIGDAATEYALQLSFSDGALVRVTGFLNLVLTRSTGAGLGELGAVAWRWSFLATTALVFAVVLIGLLSTPLRWPQAAAYGLLLGGSLGNAIDHLMYAQLNDFVDFHLRGWHWPAFNLADVAILIGAAILIVSTVLREPSGPPSQPKTSR